MTTSYYAAPQRPDDAKRLFEAAYTSSYGADLSRPPTVGRGAGSALVLAREWGLSELEQFLVDAVEERFEPTWNTDRGEFTWGFGLEEPHPRGQFNAFMAAAEAAGPGRWTNLSASPLEPCPQVVDVDFPNVALTRAEWHQERLYLRLSPLREDPNKWTEFRIVGAEPRLWWLSGIEGATVDVTARSVNVRVPLVAGDLEFVPGSY